MKHVHPLRLALWCVIVLMHLLLLVLLSRSNGKLNPQANPSFMTIFSIAIDRAPTLAMKEESSQVLAAKVRPPATAVLKKNSAHTAELPPQRETNAEANVEAKNMEEVASQGATPTSSNTLNNGVPLGSLASRYKLQIPKTLEEETLTPAQQAAQDVRSNSAKLTKSEKIAVAMGTLDCVFQTRLPNGKVVREPGKWVEMAARSNVTLLRLATARFCVRLHQAEDQNGNDLTAISSGIKGKL